MNDKKKKRRKERHERNILKERLYKEKAWEDGKLIEENHNQKPYSIEYTKNLAERLIKILINNNNQDTKYIILNYQKHKQKIRDLILLWNPELEKNNIYFFLKKSLEIYWDNIELLPTFLKNNSINNNTTKND